MTKSHVFFACGALVAAWAVAAICAAEGDARRRDHDHTCSDKCAASEEHMRAMDEDAWRQIDEADDEFDTSADEILDKIHSGAPVEFAERESTLRWFGHRYDAPAWESMREVITPYGQTCIGGCGQLIGLDDDGITIPDAMTGERSPMHVHCFVTSLGALMPKRLDDD